MISKPVPLPGRWSWWCCGGWVLAALAGPPAVGAQSEAQVALGTLEQNFPNPFTSKTAIRFEILPQACADGERPRVTIQILNVLVQMVAAPTVRDSLVRVPVEDMEFDCGRHLAFWDRTLSDGEQKAAPGSYFYRLFVNGESQAIRLMQVREPVSRPTPPTP